MNYIQRQFYASVRVLVADYCYDQITFSAAVLHRYSCNINRGAKKIVPLPTSRLPVRYVPSVSEGLIAARIGCQSPTVK